MTKFCFLPSASFFKELETELALPVVHAFLYFFASLFFFPLKLFSSEKKP